MDSFERKNKLFRLVTIKFTKTKIVICGETIIPAQGFAKLKCIDIVRTNFTKTPFIF
ncbi:hypothetical protein PACTADRAFT_50281 [Pachysolen tannophilus NRRL Y-2460]|uniref:Uncharacterized protein n=1 Tax=Pachysolen tannophilus NRRL Y-2460 TaxID=669874 RepID=A0A1E4TV26_PACTA|nr:hypothetical protein PACTADRAFT_50281 [Pachysolen tannophilus NRRL Y-2460]